MEINAFLLYTHTFSVSPFRMRENLVFFFFYYIPNGLRLLFTGEILPKEKKKTVAASDSQPTV
jgi:hypothetical protein